MRTVGGYVCGDLDGRRMAILSADRLNGIDDVEVDRGARGVPRQCTLLVRCLRDVPAGLRADAVAVWPDGGPQTRPVEVVWAVPATELAELAAEGLVTAEDLSHFTDAVPSTLLVVRIAAPGDRSSYRFVIRDPGSAGFDPLLSEACFSFRGDCDDDVDCAVPIDCPPVRAAEPVIDYLSRDYAGLRQLLLDRLSVVAGSWTDRNVADTGVTVVEIFAYLGDLLAAAQDAVGAEAYLGTARRRVSVARHARLLDYQMHHGAAARVWLALEVDDTASASFARLAACPPAGEPRPSMIPADHEIRSEDGSVTFHTLHPTTPLAVRNRIELHTWGLQQCCLPVGATSTTLIGSTAELELAAGDVLIFEEVLGATPGTPADETHRWPVRLSDDPVDDHDPVTDTDIMHVSWFDEDRLPFALCARRFSRGRCVDDVGVAVARGNVVLAGHGRLVGPQPVVPATVPLDGRYAPAIDSPNMAFSVPYVDAIARKSPAAQATTVDPKDALAELTRLTDGRNDWTLQRDLLGSDRFALDVVAEPDDDGTVHLRFGDDVSGRRPSAGQTFMAEYRIGGGAAGNIGPEVLTVLSPPVPGVQLRNPLAAIGGSEPEPMEQVRQSAPQAFREQQRAVTDEDYATIALQNPRVQRAVGTRRWTGSWYTEFVTVDRLGGIGLDAALSATLTGSLDRYRMTGTDVVVQPPVYVPLTIQLLVRVRFNSFRGTVKQALQRAFSTRDLPDGSRGFFHPDRFTFGTPLYLSAVAAAAMAVPGVDWVDAKIFQRLGQPSAGELADGVISLDRLEVLRCDSEPGDTASGRIQFTMSGGL